MADPKAVGQQFLAAFYQTFDTNRAALGNLYVRGSAMEAPDAQLTYEGQLLSGRETIAQKLIGLPFQSIQHVITTLDAQMTVDGGLLVFAVGQLKADNDQVLGFSETFYLKQIGESLFIVNDFFRLSLHHQ